MRKKLLLTLAGSMALCLGANAQASGYGFTASSGVFTPITGGTVVSTTIPDSYTSPNITFSPGFMFAGVTYTNAYFTSNGLITLGGTTAPSSTQYNGIANNTGSGIAICPFNADMVGSSATGANPNMRFETVGNEHVFQWQDVSRWTAGTDRMNIQARFNTVTKTITFVYDLVSAGSSVNYQPVIGIRTSATDYKNLLVTDTGTETWAAPLTGTATSNQVRFTTAAPAKVFTSGQTYVWTPPSCMAPAFVNFSVTNITYSSSTVSWTPGNTESSWIFEYSAPTTTMMTASPSITLNNLNPTTSYTVRTRAYCGVGDTSSFTAVRVFTTLCVPALVSSTSNGNICVTGSVNLQATTATSATLKWYANATGGSTISTDPTYGTPTLTSTTIYYVSAIGNNCEGPRVPVTASVSQRPYIAVVSSAIGGSICAGSSANLVAGGGATSYTWLPSGGHLATANVSPASNTTYTVAGENSPGCSSTTTIALVVNPAPLVTASAVNPILCNSQVATLTAVSNAITYMWYPDGGIDATALVTPSVSTNYIVTGIDALGCTSTATVELTVSPAPVLNALASKTLSCPGEEVTLFANTDATSFVWSTGSTSLNTVVNPMSSTVYSINASNGICSVDAFVTITIDACTGINKINGDSGFGMYPHPVKDALTVTAPTGVKATIRVYDMIGKLVLTQELTQESNKISVDNLQQGIYVYKIADDRRELKAGKIIKQ